MNMDGPDSSSASSDDEHAPKSESSGTLSEHGGSKSEFNSGTEDHSMSSHETSAGKRSLDCQKIGRLDADNTYSDSQELPSKSRSNKRELLREATEQPDLYGIRRSGRQRKEVTRLSLGSSSNSDEKPRKRKARASNQGIYDSESESESSGSEYGDGGSAAPKRQVARSRSTRTRQSTRYGRQTAKKHLSSSGEDGESEESESDDERNSEDDKPKRRKPVGRSHSSKNQSSRNKKASKQRSTRASNQKVSYKEESDDVTESDDLIEVEMTEADQDKEVAETVEKVVRHRTGPIGATGSKTAMYNVEKDGDPCEYADDKNACETQYLIKWKSWSHMHNTWESEASLKEQKVNGMKKVENYIKKEDELSKWRNRASPEDWEYYECQQEMMEDLYKQYCQVERVVTHYPPKPNSENSEYLVKWKGLPYCDCTHEDGDLILKYFPEAVEEYKNRQKSLLSPSTKSCKVLKVRPKFATIKDQPEYLGSSELRLRDYQMEGLNWLLHSWCKENSVILADEMGLGKTIQIISFVSVLMNMHHLYGPYLVVVPLSTLVTWQKEFQIWAPHVNVVVYIGDVTSRSVIREHEWYHANSKRVKFNVIITTYEILLKDKSILGAISWAMLLVDEAHRLKNDDSLLYKVLINFDTNHRVFITGTPLQNSLKELWSLLHFIMPDKFSRWEDFEQKHKTADRTGFRHLHQELEPYLIRRVKKDVEKSLPAKVEQILRIEMSKVQRQYYRWILTKNYKALTKGVKGSITGFINLVMELKKCCNHSFLVRSPDSSEENANVDRFELLVKSSGKLILLDKLLLRLKEAGHRVLIFSQMVRMLDILAEYMQLRRFPFQRLDGTIRGDVRKQAMDHFNAEGSSDFCFLLSTRAGGLGVNLATADTVIIFDSDWNPQNDLQAEARAHRIGQKNQVSVYRLVTKNSVEEDIVERAKKKMVLDHLVIQRMDTTGRTVLNRDGLGSRSSNTPFSKEELNSILKFGAEELFKETEDDDDVQVDIDDILRMAETRSTEEMKSSATDELLSQFKVVSFENLEDEELEGRDKIQQTKDWNEIIPENERKKIEEEDLKQQMEELNLPPRSRKQINDAGAGYPDSDVDDDKKTRQRKYEDETESSEDDSDASDDKQVRKRGRVKAGRDMVKGFTDAEIRRLIKSLRKFPRPKERLDDLAADAELQEKSEADLSYLIDLLLTNCRQTMKEYDEKIKEPICATATAATNEPGGNRRQIGRASFRLSNVSINAKSLLQSIEELEPLAVLMPANPKEREKFRLNERVKTALFDCEWDLEDDSLLLRGVYEYGFGNWEAIKMDENLKLHNKILPGGELRPQAKHLQTRTEYLLKLLRKQTTSEDDSKTKVPKKPRAKAVSKKVKSKEIVEDNLGSDDESGKEKDISKDVDASQDKTGDGRKKKKEKDSKEVKSKKEDKQTTKKRSPKKGANAAVGPLHFTTGQTVSVDEDGGVKLPPDIFNECKDQMRAVKRSLKHLGEPDTEQSEKEQLAHTRECLLNIGNHIAEVLAEFKDPDKIKEWRSYLWVFVSQFTEFDATRLHKLYKHALRKQEEAQEREPGEIGIRYKSHTKVSNAARKPLNGPKDKYPDRHNDSNHRHHEHHHHHESGKKAADGAIGAHHDRPVQRFSRNGPATAHQNDHQALLSTSVGHSRDSTSNHGPSGYNRDLASRESTRVSSEKDQLISPLSKDEPHVARNRYGETYHGRPSQSHQYGSGYQSKHGQTGTQSGRYDHRGNDDSDRSNNLAAPRGQGYNPNSYSGGSRGGGGRQHYQSDQAGSGFGASGAHYTGSRDRSFDRKRRPEPDQRDPRYHHSKEPRLMTEGTYSLESSGRSTLPSPASFSSHPSIAAPHARHSVIPPIAAPSGDQRASRHTPLPAPPSSTTLMH